MADGWKVTIAAPDNEQLRPMLDELHRAGANHVRVPPETTARRGRVPAILGFIVALVRVRPHAVLLALPWPRFAFGQLLACALLSVPTVVVFQLVPADGTGLSRELEPRRRLYRWARSRRQTWIGVSEHARRTVAEVFAAPEQAIGRIYNGVEIRRAPARGSGEPDVDGRRALELSPGDFVVLAIGRLTTQKAHSDLIEAVGLLAERHPQLRLLIAGDGPERPRLEELIARLGISDQVRLLGHVQDPLRLHAVADVLGFPSRYEGTPFAMLEAMASGLPVVAARFGGADEIVEHGRDGLLVDPGGAAALGAAIEDVMGDSPALAAMGASAQCTVERFSQASMVDQTLAALGHAAAG